MLIEYVGHSCFYITNQNGVRIITDPYDPSIGLAPVCKQADIVLVSHHHYDHDYLDGVSGDFDLIDKPGSYEPCGVRVIGTGVPHDNAGGKNRGMVTAFKIETEGLTVLHMGDVGMMPPERFFDWAGNVDILMVPVGGNYTVDAAGAIGIIEKMKPNIAIPMHYKTTHLNLDIETERPFITLAKKRFDIAYLGGSKFELTAEEKKKRGRILLMENSFVEV